MKNRHYSAAILPAILAALAVVFSPTAASAQSTLYWYPAAAPNQGGTGTWDTTASRWSETAGATKTIPASAPVDGDSVVFGGANGVVTLSPGMSGILLDDFEVDTANYTFRPNGSNRIISVNSFSGSALSSSIIEGGGVHSLTLDIRSNTAFTGTIQNGTNTLALVKTGNGDLNLTSASLTNTQAYSINQGKVLISAAQATSGISGAIRLTQVDGQSAGMVVVGNGNPTSFNRSFGSGAGQFTVGSGTMTSGVAGFGARNGDLNINFGGAEATAIWALGSNNLRVQTLVLGTSDSTHTVRLANPLQLNSDGLILRTENGAASIDGEVSGGFSTTVTTTTGRILTKDGAGTLRIGGTTSTSVRLNHTAGTILIDGNWTSDFNGVGYGIQVASGAVLGGNGTINPSAAPTQISGTLMGGRGLLGSANQSLTLNGTVNLLSNSTLAFGLGATASDQIIRTGGSWSFQSLQQVQLFDMGADTITYTLISGLASTVDVSGWTLVNSGLLFGTFSSDASNVYFTLDVIPEPSSALLMALGMGAMYFIRRRRS